MDFRALLLLAAWAGTAAAVTPIYDETLWTKQLWSKWKLDKAMFTVNPTEETPALLTAYPQLQGAVQNSLNGPFPQDSLIPARSDMLDTEALSDPTFLGPASQAVRCTVCHTLVTRVWQRVVVDVLRGNLNAGHAPNFLPKMLAESCEHEVWTLLIRKVIYRMEVDNGRQAMTFFVLRVRKPGSSPTKAEKAAVQLACKDILATGQAQLVEILSKHLKDFKKDVDQLLIAHGVQAGQAGTNMQPDKPADAAGEASQQQPGDTTTPTTGDASQATGAADASATTIGAGTDASTGTAGAAGTGAAAAAQPGKTASQESLEGMITKLLKGIADQLKKQGIGIKVDGLDGQEDVDDYLDVDDDDDDAEECQDLHPMCEQWANEGECDANPNYMVGNARLKGHCRKACGLCTPGISPTELLKSHPKLAKDVQAVSKGLMQAAKSQACGATQSCLTSNAGVAIQAAVLTRQQGEIPGKPPTAGFQLGRPSWGYPQVRESAGSRAVLKAQQAAAASAAATQQEEDSSKAQLQRQVDQVLSSELGGKLLHLSDEFFTYEFLYKNHTRHFHEEPALSGKFTEDWMLGTFTRESVLVESAAAGGTAVLERLDLLADQLDPEMSATSWPYVKQVYGNGDLCVLGDGRQVVRKTEVRIACSPDARLHFLMREPDFCHYVFVIYSPALCGVPAFKPLPQPTPNQ